MWPEGWKINLETTQKPKKLDSINPEGQEEPGPPRSDLDVSPGLDVEDPWQVKEQKAASLETSNST